MRYMDNKYVNDETQFFYFIVMKYFVTVVLSHLADCLKEITVKHIIKLHGHLYSKG